MRTHLNQTMFKAYKDARKKQIGNYLKRFYKDESMWPSELVAWWAAKVDTLPATVSWRGLTVRYLLEFMSQETGLTQLIEGADNARYFEDRLSEWGRWESDTKRGGVDILLAVAMCSCKVLKDERTDNVLDSPEKFIDFMMSDD